MLVVVRSSYGSFNYSSRQKCLRVTSMLLPCNHHRDNGHGLYSSTRRISLRVQSRCNVVLVIGRRTVADDTAHSTWSSCARQHSSECRGRA